MNGPSLTRGSGPSLQGPRVNNNPDPLSEYARRLTDLRRQMNDLTGSILKSAGIDVAPDGMTINSALDVLGSLDVNGPMTVTGDAVFSGDLAVPNGSITNDALANPILPEPISGTGSGFATAASAWETKASDTLVTPAGFTRALVIANGGMTLTNTTGLAARSFVARTVIGSSTGFQVRVSNIDVSMIASTGANHTALISGLTEGATFTVGTQVFTNAAWPGDSNNQAGVNGVVLWLR